MLGGRFGAEDAVAPLDRIKIEFKDTLLGKVLFEKHGDDRFTKLSPDGSFRNEVEVLCELLGNRGGAAEAASVAIGVRDRVPEFRKVETVM